MTRWLHLGAVVVGLICGGAVLLAQAHAPVHLEGSVRDISKPIGYLEGATVKVTSHRTGAVVALTTDVDGKFHLPALDPGKYTVAISIRGYEQLVDDNFCVVPGRPAKLNAVLVPDRGGSRAAATPVREHTIVQAPVLLSDVAAMTLAEVRDAMTLGRRSTYLDAPALSQSGFLIRRRTGAILTPFWRIAKMSQIASATRRHFSEHEIPAAFTQKMVWIVGSPVEYYTMDYGDMDSPQYLRPVSEIMVLDKTASGSTELKAAWNIYLASVCDVTILETVLGPQFRRPSLIAAFPLDIIKPGNVIVFRYSTTATALDGEALKVPTEARHVTISRADMRKWK